LSHSYPSDISRVQFGKIRPILESARKQTRTRTIDLYSSHMKYGESSLKYSDELVLELLENVWRC
jgi:hypothetical protein